MKSTRSFRFLLASRVLLAGLILSGAVAPLSYAKEFRVNTTADTDPGTGGCTDTNTNCSLRAAIEQANKSPDESNSIVLNEDRYTLTEGQLEITRSLSLFGVESGSTIISALDTNGNRTSRIFAISNPGTNPVVTISRVIITGGNGIPVPGAFPGQGGGIRIFEGCFLTMGYCVVRDNRNGQRGAGIANEGVLELAFSTVENNKNIGSVQGGGLQSTAGGIYNDGSGTVRIFNSTISGNEALRGGGINNYGRLEVYNSTISGNIAYGGGGGIRNGAGLPQEPRTSAIATISFSTITNNTANAEKPMKTERETYRNGGGIENFNTVKMDNTIVAGNIHCLRCPPVAVDVADDSPDCYSKPPAVFTSFRHNVVDVVNDNWNLQDFEAAGLPFDKVGVGKDPGLGEFAYHGGPNQPNQLGGLVTMTYSLEPGSPARDYADCPPSLPNKPPFTDQRGAWRAGGFFGCDVGAFELGEPHTASGLVGLKPSGFIHILEKKQTLQTVNLINTTGLPLNAPFFFLVLDKCTHTLLNRDGVSINVGLMGSDYAIFHVRHSGGLFPGEETILPITLKFENRDNPPKDIPYTPRILTGTGMP